MWISIDYAVERATQQGIPRAEVEAAVQSGALPTDRPDPRGPAKIILRDLDEWTAGRPSR